MKALPTFLLTGLAALAAALVAALPAAAQAPQCAPLDRVVEGLSTGWQEAPVGRGIQGGELIVMVFAAPGGDTWTIIGVAADGTACLLASGTAWEALPRPAPGVEG
jgi:hypothetical protein